MDCLLLFTFCLSALNQIDPLCALRELFCGLSEEEKFRAKIAEIKTRKENVPIYQ